MTPDKGSRSKRLFLGTFLPESARQSLEQLRFYDEQLTADWSAKLRWVAAEKLHLTWLFLGLVDQARLAELKAAIDRLLYRQPPLSLIYSQAALWPSARHCRHVVLVPDFVPEDITYLAQTLSRALGSYVEKPDKKPYRPHITILNMDGQDGLLSVPDWLGLEQKLPIEHCIDRIELIESHLGGNKQYESLFSWPLQNTYRETLP